MAAQYLTSWNPTVIVAVHTTLLGMLNAGSTVEIYSSADVLLGTITLATPAGTVDNGTGRLALAQASSGSGVAAGTASYVSLKVGSTVYRSLPCFEGTSPSPNTCVINSLSITVGKQLDIVSFIIE